jgi:hypothetical protein
MKTQSLAATSSVLNIKMVGTAVELEGVVVTALGIKKSKNSVTGNINEELTQAANPNVVQSLVGKSIWSTNQQIFKWSKWN